MRKTYTGVGSRQTPMYILYMMSELAMIFERKGYLLRSGCATGADAAFEDALLDPANNSEIYVPNRGFSGNMGTTHKPYYIIPKERFGTSFKGLYYQATRLIHQKDIHKFWQRCSPHTMDLHNRNMFQVLGLDLKSKSNFNICYTKNKELKYKDTDKNTGGTGTSINASDLYGITLFNLSVDEHYLRLKKFIYENKSLVDYDRLNKIKPRTEVYNERDNKGHFLKTYEAFESVILKERKERELKLENEVLKLEQKKEKKTKKYKY